MTSGIFKLIDASLVQQNKFDNISHNLANSSTNGFKKSIFTFDQSLSTVTHSVTDFTTGPIVHTGNELDMALESKGFFKIQTVNGIRYTRDGAFTLNQDHVLVTRSGDPVLGKSGSIKLNSNDITIGVDGQVGSGGQIIDKLSVAEFENNQLLNKEGLSYYVYTGDESDAIVSADPNVRQRYLEKSNVEATEEMIKMIDAFRAFESVQKAIQNLDEVTSKVVNDPVLTQ